MRRLALVTALLLVAAPVVEAQRGGAGQGRGAGGTEEPAARGAGGGRGGGEGRNGGPDVDRSKWKAIDVDKARARMRERVNWIASELRLAPSQKKALTELFELELWAASARGVEPFDSNPNPKDDPGNRIVVRTITRGELEDRNGLLTTSPSTARAAKGAEDSGRGGRGGGRGEPEADPGVPPDASPELAAALAAIRAEKVQITVKTTHPMLADLTAATLDGIIPLLEVSQVAEYMDLLGDEGLLLVRAHAAHRIDGYMKLDQGVAALPPVPTQDWTVEKRQVRKRRVGVSGGRRQSLIGRRRRNKR